MIIPESILKIKNTIIIAIKLEIKLKKYNVEFRLYDFDVKIVITSLFPIRQNV